MIQNFRAGLWLDFDSRTRQVNLQPPVLTPEGLPVSGQRWRIRSFPNEQFHVIENVRGGVLDFDSRTLLVNLQDPVADGNGGPVSGQRWRIHQVPGEDLFVIENERASKVLDFIPR
ncbi:MAG TPA: hypothetical protein VF170_07835 [Planctomycetaceae bacterium]